MGNYLAKFLIVALTFLPGCRYLDEKWGLEDCNSLTAHVGVGEEGNFTASGNKYRVEVLEASEKKVRVRVNNREMVVKKKEGTYFTTRYHRDNMIFFKGIDGDRAVIEIYEDAE